MYICQLCGGQVPANTPSYSVVTETRQRTYPARTYYSRQKGKFKKIEDPGGKGWEIVAEIRVCETCKTRFTPVSPRLETDIPNV